MTTNPTLTAEDVVKQIAHEYRFNVFQNSDLSDGDIHVNRRNEPGSKVKAKGLVEAYAAQQVKKANQSGSGWKRFNKPFPKKKQLFLYNQDNNEYSFGVFGYMGGSPYSKTKHYNFETQSGGIFTATHYQVPQAPKSDD